MEINPRKRFESPEDVGAYKPTEEEIKMHCLNFQKKWSAADRKFRSAGADIADTIDTVNITQINLKDIRRI